MVDFKDRSWIELTVVFLIDVIVIVYTIILFLDVLSLKVDPGIAVFRLIPCMFFALFIAWRYKMLSFAERTPQKPEPKNEGFQSILEEVEEKMGKDPHIIRRR